MLKLRYNCKKKLTLGKEISFHFPWHVVGSAALVLLVIKGTQNDVLYTITMLIYSIPLLFFMQIYVLSCISRGKQRMF